MQKNEKEELELENESKPNQSLTISPLKRSFYNFEEDQQY